MILPLFLISLLCLDSATIYDGTSCKDQKRFLVFDAGSSKTELLFYKFEKDFTGHMKVAESKSFGKTTALSRMTSKASLNQLRSEINGKLNEAKKYIKEECIKDTWVFLRGTAGLRSLSQNTANNLLKNVREIFLKSVFKQAGDDSAQVLKGEEESLWLWVFMNFETENFDTCNTKMVTTFDMGGGSTQLATLADRINPTYEMRRDVTTHVFNGCSYDVYAVSYEPFGADENRKKFFINSNLASECMAKGVTSKFEFGQTKATFVGNGTGGADQYDKCLLIAENFVETGKFRKVWSETDEPKDLTFVSAFYWVPLTAKALFKSCKSFKEDGCGPKTSYQMTLGELDNYARYFCENPISDLDTIKEYRFSEYLCIDLMWIKSLLERGYGLKNKELVFTMLEKINGDKVGWPLGFAYGLASK